MSSNDVKVDVTIGEASTEEELNTSIEGLSAEIQKDRELNPDSFFEAGWVDLEADGRAPAQNVIARSSTFITNLVQKLKGKNIQADRVAEMQVPAKQLTLKDSWYLNNSKLTWTIIRVSNSTGFRVGSLIFTGLSPLHSVELSSSLVLACTLSSVFYIPINHFSNKARFYEHMNLNKFPGLKKILSNPATAKRIDVIHGKANWGLVEVAFGGVVILGENAVRKMLGLPIELPTLLQYGISTGMAIATQQVWDRAVGKYEDLQNLLHIHNGGNVKDPLFIKQRNANIHKRGAFGSILSVVGFSWSSSQNTVVKLSGYATLGALGIAGNLYERHIDAKIARHLSQINVCNSILGGEMPPIDENDLAG